MADINDSIIASEPTRRSFGRLAASAVVAGGFVGTALVATDPTFKLIDEFLRLDEVFRTWCVRCDTVTARRAVPPRIITADDKASREAAQIAADDAMDNFLAMPPTSLPGVRAFLAHVKDVGWGDEQFETAIATLLNSPALLSAA